MTIHEKLSPKGKIGGPTGGGGFKKKEQTIPDQSGPPGNQPVRVHHPHERRKGPTSLKVPLEVRERGQPAPKKFTEDREAEDVGLMQKKPAKLFSRGTKEEIMITLTKKAPRLSKPLLAGKSFRGSSAMK